MEPLYFDTKDGWYFIYFLLAEAKQITQVKDLDTAASVVKGITDNMPFISMVDYELRIYKWSGIKMILIRNFDHEKV